MLIYYLDEKVSDFIKLFTNCYKIYNQWNLNLSWRQMLVPVLEKRFYWWSKRKA